MSYAIKLDSILKILFVLFFLVFSSSCGGGSDDGVSSDCGNFRIINGEECSRTTIPTVLLEIATPLGSAICTGTIIGNSAILTAAHCAEGVTAARIIHDNGVVDGEVAIAHPFFDGSSDFDIGLILASNVSGILGVAPAVVGSFTEVSIGDRLTVIGYGRNEDGLSGLGLPGANPRVTDIEVVDINPTIIANTFEATNSNACFGDSGAAAFWDGRIVGVESAGTTSTCQEGDINFFTRTRSQGAFDFISGNVPDAQFE